MKIVFTSSYKTFFKENTKNYTPNSYVLVFLISVIFFAYNLGRREYILKIVLEKKIEFNLHLILKITHLYKYKVTVKKIILFSF